LTGNLFFGFRQVKKQENSFKGNIALVAIYNTAMSIEEIAYTQQYFIQGILHTKGTEVFRRRILKISSPTG
jgi:hypothetical protein